MKIESSVPFRAAVAASVLVAVTAGLSQGAVELGTGIVALVLIAVGYVVSHIRREQRNILLKTALAIGLFVAFAGFLGAVRGAASVDDTRVPLTALFLWVQVLHAFDVPRPRDLSFSLASSVALIALAGSLAFSTGFAFFVLAYAILFGASLVLGHLAGLRAQPVSRPDRGSARLRTGVLPPGPRPDRGSARLRTGVLPPGPPLAEVRRTRTDRPKARAALRPAAMLLVGSLVTSFVAFVFIPRIDATPVATLPFSIDIGSPVGGFNGQVAHPSQGGSGSSSGGGTTSTAFDPNAYWGYGEQLDLRTRGQLSDELVMRVRAPRGSLYRAQVYDRYEDGRWTSSDEELDEAHRSVLDSINIPWTRDDRFARGDELVQTFYVERALPNIVFHAHRAREVFSSSTTVFVDDFNSIRLPFFLEEDTIYSVVSQVPPRDPEILRTTFAQQPDLADPMFSRYLQLPDSVSERFTGLAGEIAGPHAHTVDKVLAVEEWLATNKRYRVDIPPDPPGTDPIETFVFDRTEGFCEQIATTMTLMLRASGVPARLVTGFGPGERNLFTGYWEVRNSDAHAWVEVYYPQVGWVSYDPTFGVPASDIASTTFALEPLGRLLAGPAASLRSIPEAFGRIGAFGSWVVIAMATLVLVGTGRALVRSSREPVASGPHERSERAWLTVERALAARGAPRGDHETAHEYVRRLSRGTPGDLEAFAELFARTRYAPADEESLGELEDRASRLAVAVRRRDADLRA